ncbi:HTH-type transcriptional regulator NsrR [Algimonas arctica]|uniref:HTH-type transcriptional regulator NsrR n=1 Tax=Algimonas arctica TaxID=1479486 RepID=A0A8J3CSV6_9PROT|nr:Rrf2 family transcriptional regulator [Algimonas arctica]GHA94573.1 HTH-type transcriptional regulator NsrR [Algimonas arctica]
MNITTFSDYALRVLIYLAVDEAEKSTAKDIAASYDISFHHVAKAAQWLAREGYIHAERGRSGGISLSRLAQDINVGELVRATEAGTALVDCMRVDGGACSIRPACGLKQALAEAQDAFYAVLDRVSLADVVVKRSALSQLLTVGD